MEPITVHAVVDLVNRDVVEVNGGARADTPLEDLAIDSLVRVQLAILFERHFGAVVQEIEIARCRTFADLVELLVERRPQ